MLVDLSDVTTSGVTLRDDLNPRSTSLGLRTVWPLTDSLFWDPTTGNNPITGRVAGCRMLGHVFIEGSSISNTDHYLTVSENDVDQKLMEVGISGSSQDATI